MAHLIPPAGSAGHGLADLTVEEKLALIEEGLPFERFELFAAELGIDPGELLEHLGTSRRTRFRRLGGAPLSGPETERVLRVAQLFHSASERSGDRMSAVRWITDPERLRRAAVGLEMSELLDELNSLTSPSSLVQRVPIPELPHGFSASEWELDDRPAPPNTLPIRCALTARLNNAVETVYVRIAPSMDSTEEHLRKIVYERFVEAIADLRMRTFSCR